MRDFRTEDLADGARIGIVAIARCFARNLPDRGDSTRKESLGRRHVARFSEHRVDQIARAIHGTVQVAPLPLTFKYVSSTYQRQPTFPLRLPRTCSASKGAKRSSHSRTASWVNS